MRFPLKDFMEERLLEVVNEQLRVAQANSAGWPSTNRSEGIEGVATAAAEKIPYGWYNATRRLLETLAIMAKCFDEAEDTAARRLLLKLAGQHEADPTNANWWANGLLSGAYAYMACLAGVGMGGSSPCHIGRVPHHHTKDGGVEFTSYGEEDRFGFVGWHLKMPMTRPDGAEKLRQLSFKVVEGGTVNWEKFTVQGRMLVGVEKDDFEVIFPDGLRI